MDFDQRQCTESYRISLPPITSHHTSSSLVAQGIISYYIRGMRQYFLVFAIILAIYTLWLFNIAMENGPFIDDFPIKTSIYKGFSMAMLNNQMVVTIEKPLATSRQEFRPKWAMASVALKLPEGNMFRKPSNVAEPGGRSDNHRKGRVRLEQRGAAEIGPLETDVIYRYIYIYMVSSSVSPPPMGWVPR